MQLSELLTQIRAAYAAKFELSLFSLGQGAAAQQLIVEGALRDRDGITIDYGDRELLAIPRRHDVLLLAERALSDLSFTSEAPPVSFPKMELPEWEGYRYVLEPFAWDKVCCSIRGKPRDYDWRPVEAFFREYFGGDDSLQAARGAIPRGLIHSIVGPSYQNEMTWLKVDFGTAPIEAFMDLGGALKDAGVEIAWFSAGFVSF